MYFNSIQVTLSWYDPPNEVFSAKCLLHDLDVVVTDPSGQIYYGNSHGSKRDELNNNEQVFVSTPTIGAWTVSVQSKLLSESLAQNYSLVITTIGVVVSIVTINGFTVIMIHSLCLLLFRILPLPLRH